LGKSGPLVLWSSFGLVRWQDIHTTQGCPSFSFEGSVRRNLGLFAFGFEARTRCGFGLGFFFVEGASDTSDLSSDVGWKIF
jgi:hypothetical protein